MAAARQVVLGEVVRFGNGKSIKPGGEGRYPVYGSNGIIGGCDEFRHENGVIIGRVGAYCGAVLYCQEKFWASDNTLVAYPANEQIDTKFLFYLLHDTKLSRYAGGAAQPLVTQTVLKQVEVRVPPLPTQQRIAGILSAYDELIENSQRRIKILETMARTLYREWFVHFRYPGSENHPRVASALGEIPKGWEVKNVGEIADTFRGRSYRSVDLAKDGGLPFLNLKCLDRDGGFRRSGLKRYTGEYKDGHIARKGDIIMAVTDMTQDRRIVARAAMVPSLDKDFGIISMDLVGIKPKASVPKDYLYAFLRYSSFADEVKQHANGANVLHLSPERITEFRFPVPPAQLMERFAAFVAPVLEQINALENKQDNLRGTRDLLLPRLLSGQIHVEAP